MNAERATSGPANAADEPEQSAPSDAAGELETAAPTVGPLPELLPEPLPETENTLTWLQSIANVLKATTPTPDQRHATRLSAHVRTDRLALFLPPEMASLQPRNLRYLQALSRKNHCLLVEDRRSANIEPMTERRHEQPPPLALGVSLLLKQAGYPGAVRALSDPHRLHPDNPHIELTRLINMLAYAQPLSKRVVLLPNSRLVEALANDTRPLVGYACRVFAQDICTRISYFESQNFRCIGYEAGSQWVMHCLLAGGPLHAPQIWIDPAVMNGSSNLRFRLYPSERREFDFGLLYSTHYIDTTRSAEDSSWWSPSLADIALGDTPTDAPVVK